MRKVKKQYRLGMKKAFTVIATSFVMGMFTGAYIFFAAGDADTDIKDPAIKSGFEISADSYGGCESAGCASYRIIESGDYIYLKRGMDGASQRFEDTVSKKRMTELEDLLNTRELEHVEETNFTGTCPITYDGVAYRFEIRLEGNQYRVDTCSQDISSSELFTKLVDYFQIFELTHGTE